MIIENNNNDNNNNNNDNDNNDVNNISDKDIKVVDYPYSNLVSPKNDIDIISGCEL